MRRALLMVGVGLAATGIFGLIPVIVGAQSAQESPSSKSDVNTIQVAPLRTDLTLSPGQQKTVKLTVSNPTDTPIAVSPSVNDFVAEGEDGSPALILNEGSHANHHSLKRLIAPLETVVIPAKESRGVEAVITAPQSLEPGGYFGAVRFVPANAGAQSQVTMSASVASLILLRVTGDAPQRLSLTNLDMQQKGTTKTVFLKADNLSVLARFENDGGVQLSPLGTIAIMRGENVIHETTFNNKTPPDLVLPGSARRWSVPVEELDGFGRYTLSGLFTYGDDNQMIEVTTSFWVIPRSFIALGAGGVVVIVAVATGMVLRHRAAARRRPRFGHRRRRY